MKIKLLILFLFISLVLTGCTSSDIDTEKKDFFVEFQDAVNFGSTVYIIKPGRIVGSEEILVSSQAYGRVRSILVEEGNEVSGGEPIIQLSDDIMSYNLKTSRAKKSLDSAVLTYEQTNTSLDKSVSDAKLALEQANHNLSIAQQSMEQSLKQAQQQLLSTNLDMGGQARLTLDKMIVDIENQILSLKSQFVVQQTQLLNNINDVLHQTDTIIGASPSYKHYNDSYEVYLGAKDSSTKVQAKDLILDLYKTESIIESLSSQDLSNKELIENIVYFSEAYQNINILLAMVRRVLESSLAGTDFSQTTINGYLATIDGLQASIQATNAGFISYESRVKSLLSDVIWDNGITDQEQINDIAQQQIQIALQNAELAQENAKIAYAQAKINAENNIFNAELAVKNAVLTYDTVQKNTSTQLKLLDTSIDQAKISYQDALKQYNKLSVRAPIPGIVSSILVDLGQEVAVGTPLFHIVSDKDQLVEIYLTADEYNYITLGENVWVEYDKKVYAAEIKSLSPVASQNMLYKAIIEIDGVLDLLGDVVSVKIPVMLDVPVLPLHILTTLQNGSGFFYRVDGTGFAKQEVRLGSTWGSYVEILSDFPQNQKIIMTDLSNYDPEKFVLIFKRIVNSSGFISPELSVVTGAIHMSGLSENNYTPPSTLNEKDEYSDKELDNILKSLDSV